MDDANRVCVVLCAVSARHEMRPNVNEPRKDKAGESERHSQHHHWATYAPAHSGKVGPSVARGGPHTAATTTEVTTAGFDCESEYSLSHSPLYLPLPICFFVAKSHPNETSLIDWLFDIP